MRPIFALLVIALLAGCASTPAPTTTTNLPTGTPDKADYGDAPDAAATGYPGGFATNGSFPTKFGSNGARAMDVSQVRLGLNASLETDATDPADPDGAANLAPSNTDGDDGLVGLVIVLTSIPPPATLTVRVSAPPGSAGGSFNLNVLIDLTMDGKWGGKAGNAPEWVAKNVPFTLAAGETKDVSTPAFAFANGLILPDGAWMRVAVTKDAITSPDWDGSGKFAIGEIEDHIIKLPAINGKKPAIPVMDCPDHIDMTGKATVTFSCTIDNIAPAGSGSNIAWTLTKIDGGVTIAAPLAGAVVVAPQTPHPGATLTFTATKGKPLPSNWAYNAVGVDPPTMVDATGVTAGYGASEGSTLFDEAVAGCVLHVLSIMGDRQHYTGESDAIWRVKVGDAKNATVAGALVTGSASGKTVTGTTDANGVAELRNRVYSYGNYPMNVASIAKEGCEYDAMANVVSGGTADVS